MPVTLPWGTPDGELRTVTVYLSTANGSPISRLSFNANVWKPAIRAAGIEDTRQNGMHVLRHTYASVLLDAGENIKALSLDLGHADPGFTLRVYTHPPADQRGPHSPSDRRRLRPRPDRPRRPGDGLAGCRDRVCPAQAGRRRHLALK